MRSLHLGQVCPGRLSWQPTFCTHIPPTAESPTVGSAGGKEGVGFPRHCQVSGSAKHEMAESRDCLLFQACDHITCAPLSQCTNQPGTPALSGPALSPPAAALVLLFCGSPATLTSPQGVRHWPLGRWGSCRTSVQFDIY